MRRADRLFQIIQMLRSRRRAVTARWIAEQLEVSERTIYRDIRDLVASGTPIAGEAGVGYTIRSGYDLPPLMFDEEEIEALSLGARVVAAFGDDELAKAAARVLRKVEVVLPKRLKGRLGNANLFAPRTAIADKTRATLAIIRAAMAEQHKLRFHYYRADGAASRRVVWPLGAMFWGSSWTLTAWCELREDFRNFRLDRMREVEVLDDGFPAEPGKTLDDYMRSITVDPDALREL